MMVHSEVDKNAVCHVRCAVDLQVSSRDNCHGVDETIASLIRFVPKLELRDNNEMRGRIGAI